MLEKFGKKNWQVIGLAFEISDARSMKNKSANNGDAAMQTRHIEIPSNLQAFCYCYNFAGLFTGT